MSYADDFTEEKLLELEKKINKVYSDAQKDLEKQAKDYFEQFAKRDEEYKKLVDSGEITKDEYKQWRLNQIGRGERINKMAANMAKRATQANEVAMAYVNDATPTIYSLNRNHEAYVIEQLGHDMTASGDFTLYNESSVRRMLVENPEVMPYYPEEKAVARGIDLEYGQKVIKAKTTSGILQGKSVYKIADDLQRDITNMNRVSAVRAARTAITSAQNGGRQDTMLAAQKMGIKLRKRWVSAKDGRVRDAHSAADGQTVNVDEPFIVGGEKLMFPGDKTSASGWNLYNCRCGMRTVEKEGIEAEQRQVRVQNPKYTEAAENEEKAKARYERAKAKEDAETDPEKKKALKKERLEKQKEYEHYSSIRKGTQKNIVVNGDMTYEEWAKLRGVKPKKTRAKMVVQEKPKFVPAISIEEAEKYADRFVDTYKTKYTGTVDYSGIQLDYANEMNRAFTEVFDAYDTKYPLRNIKPFNMREARFKGTSAEAAYQWGTRDVFYNKGYYKTQKAFNAHLQEYNDLIGQVMPNIDLVIEQYKKGASGSLGKAKLRYIEALKRTGRTNVSPPNAYGSTIHEMGHYLDDDLFRKSMEDNDFDLSESFDKYSGSISAYATSNPQEYVAESFTAYWKGETDILDPNLVKIFEGTKKK